MEHVEEERLSTADLADAGREEPRNANLDLTHAEVLASPRDEGRVPVAPPTVPGRSSVQAVPGSQAGVGGTATAMAKEPESGPLFSQEEAGNLRTKWDAIQVGFVDEPRRAVVDADSLVAMAMKRLAEQLSKKQNIHYSVVSGWLRCRLSFALLRTTLLCVRATRRKRFTSARARPLAVTLPHQTFGEHSS